MAQNKSAVSLRINQNRGDFVVSSIIDVILTVTDWGPEGLSPDFFLGRDLEMNDGQIREFVRELEKIFGDSVALNFINRDLTLRQIAMKIKSEYRSAA